MTQHDSDEGVMIGTTKGLTLGDEVRDSVVGGILLMLDEEQLAATWS